jgi:hypothetical protein
MGKNSEEAYWGRQEALSEYRTWLEGGADVASMRGVCPETRVVLVAAPPEWTLSAFRYTLLHEFYHAFQQDLETEGLCRQRSKCLIKIQFGWWRERLTTKLHGF